MPVVKRGAFNRSATPPARRSISGCDPLDPAHVGPEHGGDTNGAVGLLIVLEDRDQRAADGQARAVQRVTVLRPAPARRAVLQVEPARLERLAVRARGDLAVLRLPRQPDLDV